MRDLVIRNARIGRAAPADVVIADGRIVAIGSVRGRAGPTIDARGGALLPGLADHHLHLLASAARQASVVLDDVRTPAALAAALAGAAAL